MGHNKGVIRLDVQLRRVEAIGQTSSRAQPSPPSKFKATAWRFAPVVRHGDADGRTELNCPALSEFGQSLRHCIELIVMCTIRERSALQDKPLHPSVSPQCESGNVPCMLLLPAGKGDFTALWLTAISSCWIA
jgi:hypothetical protein